ncbi:22976_t:CDS:10 [Rhizophagus irregularis]|uniref:STAS domain-containing protein n=1 Tax=Rhizophagus irregularis (strain DAOM 181602 / DAOM 197198 / MUCL 43194) TaxID=747089 RepID=U9T988_RHIID|nr:22976_t:CDS:10 [Rhizophagus irregularis]
MSNDTNNNPNLLYTEKGPSLKSQFNDFFKQFPHHSLEYTKSIFPIRNWIGRYNLTWLYGDLIAGFTVGAVVIPQAMGFANIVGIPVEYGLYSSFVGMTLYCLFATSKDMTIGPTAVMSIILAQTIPRVKADYGDTDFPYLSTDITTTICFFSGIISLAIGLFRLGWLFNFIPGPVIAGYISASVITISIGQLPNLFGITGVETRLNPPYRILIDFCAGLPRTKSDVAIGLISLAFLYAVKYGCAYGEKRSTKYKKVFFFCGILRVVKKVPRGLNHVKVPNFEPQLVNAVFKSIHIIVLISLLEHISIAKSFGRINDYKVQPSQEIIAIGITNVIGSFLGAITATGSFSRSALKSRAGVRTPLSGVSSATLVILALYVLTPAFFYIPQAALSAVIIQAVMVLLSRPSYIRTLYYVECNLGLGCLRYCYRSLHNGIFASWGFSFIVLLARMARPRVDTLGRLALATFNRKSDKSDDSIPKYAFVPLEDPSFTTVETPPEGIVIFRFTESLTFPNSNYIDDSIVEYIELHTRRLYKRAVKKDDQPWNETDGLVDAAENEKLLPLRAVIYDFSAISYVDTSGFQALIDVRKAVNKHAAREVEYHFVNILDERVQNALIRADFGRQIPIITESINEKTENNIEEGIEFPKTNKRFFHLTIEEAIVEAQS